MDFRHHYPSAAIQAAIWNVNLDEGKRVEPIQFMPGWELTEKPKRHIATADELVAFLGAVRA